MSAAVRIQVTIEVSTGASYGDDWTLADITKQVKEEGLQMLHNRLNQDGLKIIGEPKVTVVKFMENEK